MYSITEYQYQQLRNTCKEAFVDEIGRQPLKEESQTTDVQQLKAEIAALADFIDHVNLGIEFMSYKDIASKLRQLSSV